MNEHLIQNRDKRIKEYQSTLREAMRQRDIFLAALNSIAGSGSTDDGAEYARKVAEDAIARGRP